MRVATMSGSEIADRLAKTDSEVAGAYLEQISPLVNGIPVKAMMGDATVVDQTTFDTRRITRYMSKVADKLVLDSNNNSTRGSMWSARKVEETRDEDIRRIFVKLEARTLQLHLAVHLSVQFRALLYYSPDSEVIRIQKELAAIDASARSDEDDQARSGDEIIASRLQQMGHSEPDHAKLFEMFYNDESLVKSMASEIDAAARSAGIVDHAKRRDELFAGLDALLMEVYNTTAVMIDENRLVTGEDGFLYTADVSRILTDSRNGAETREGVFEIAAMPKAEQDALASLMGQLLSAVRSAS